MEMRLKGRVPVCAGFLLLQEDNFEIVGRPDEQMVREWRAAQNRAVAAAGFGTSAPVFQALTKDVCASQITNRQFYCFFSCLFFNATI